MKLSVTITASGSKFSPIVFNGDYLTQIEKAYELGFKAVELHIGNPHKIDAEGILRTAEKYGIEISSIGTGQAYVDEGLSFTSKNLAIYEKALKRIKDQIELGQYWNSKIIIGTMRGFMLEEEKDREDLYKQVVKAIKECAQYAHKKGVVLVLEAINRYEMNFLNTADETLNFIDELQEPALGVHLDTFHMNIEEASIPEAICNMKDKLLHIHLADSNRLAVGWGHINFLEVLSALKKINYQGVLSLEHLPLPDSQKAARQSQNYLSNLLTKL